MRLRLYQHENENWLGLTYLCKRSASSTGAALQLCVIGSNEMELLVHYINRVCVCLMYLYYADIYMFVDVPELLHNYP